MTMREKMARVMYEADVAALRAIAKNPDDIVTTDFALWREGYFRRVDAALDALMQPTAEMLDAPRAGFCDTFPETRHDVWAVMVLAAKEGK